MAEKAKMLKILLFYTEISHLIAFSTAVINFVENFSTNIPFCFAHMIYVKFSLNSLRESDN